MTAPSRREPDAGPRAGGRSESRGAADRVRRSHAQTRTTVQLALGFIAAAVVAAVWSDSRWLPLHLFLAGGLLLTISGVSLMLTVTWATAPAPPDWVVAVQRTCLALGVAGVAVGHEADLGGAVLVPAGALAVIGLVVLAATLVVTVRRGVQRRFDPAVGAYALALCAGAAGVTIGVIMASGTPTVALRSAHMTLNVLGLVGLVAYGTLPFFAATVGRARMDPRASRGVLGSSVLWQATAVAVTVVGLATDVRAIAVIGLGAYAAGLAAVLYLLPKPTKRQLDWAGPRLIGMWIGVLWWATAVIGVAVEVGRGGAAFGGRWLLALVVGGYAQILWGSLAYLLPVLRGGGPELLSGGFAATRSWLGLAAANVAAAAFALEWLTVAVVAVVVWSVDMAIRAVSVGLGRRSERDRPEPAGSES